MTIKLNAHDFITPEKDQRMHIIATAKEINVKDNQSLSIKFEVQETFGAYIPEISKIYYCNLPELEKAKEFAPYNYRHMLESILYSLNVDASGEVDLTQIIGRTYLISIQKKVFEETGYVFYNAVNFIPYEEQSEEINVDSYQGSILQDDAPFREVPEEVLNQSNWDSLQQSAVNWEPDDFDPTDPRNEGVPF